MAGLVPTNDLPDNLRIVPADDLPDNNQGFLGKAKAGVKQVGKNLVGMAENATNQATALAAMANPIQAVGNVLGTAGAEAVDYISNLGSKTDTRTLGDRLSHVGEVIRENIGKQTYQPQTEAGQQQVETTGNVLTAIPQTVDVIDEATGNKFKSNFPNTYAATQMAGELAPFAVAGKAIHGALEKPALSGSRVVPVEDLPEEAIKFNHDNLSAETTVPVEASAAVQNTAPEVKPVIVGTPEQMAAVDRTGKAEYVADGKTYLIDEQGAQAKYGGSVEEAVTKAKEAIDQGDAAESDALGYANREGVKNPVTAAVDTQGKVLTDPAEIAQKAQTKEVVFANEGKPAESVAKAEEVATAINNASGESAASVEAMNRLKSEAKQGVRTVRVDTRSGKETPLIGVDAVDINPGPFDEIVKYSDGKRTVISSGDKARSYTPQETPVEVAPKDNGIRGATPTIDNGIRGAIPKMPEEAPPQHPPTTGIKNAITDAEREAAGLPPIEKPATKTLDTSFEEGKRLVDSGQFNLDTVKQIAEKPRTLSDAENMAMDHLKRQNIEQHDSVTQQLIDAQKAGDAQAIRDLSAARDALEKGRQTIDEAAKASGTEWGRSGRSRQTEIAEDYSLVRNINRMRAATPGGEITPETRAKIETLTKQIEEANRKIAERDDKIAEMKLQKAIKGIEKEEAFTQRRARRAATKEALSTEFTNLTAELNKKLMRVSANPMLDPETVALLGEIAKNRVRAGITSAAELVDSIHHAIDGAIDKRDIRDAISGYGKTMTMSQEADAKMLRELKAQMRLISSLEDVKDKGEPPLRSGLQRDPQSDTIRAMQREVKQAMAEKGIADKTSRSPEQQWKTQMDAVKTRLRNQISDITRQLETGEKTPKRKGLTYDEEATVLRQQRDELKAQLVAIEGKPGQSYEQKLRTYKTRTENRIAEIEKKIAEGDTSKPPKRQPLELDTEGRYLKAQLERSKFQLDKMVKMEELKNRNSYEKGLDWFSKWRRAVILSGSATLVKLTTAASMRMAITPLEEIIGAGLSKVPGLSTIAGKAAREGGINIAGEAKAFRQAFEKQSYKDMWEMAKTGTASLDLLYGKKHALPDAALDFFGHLHGALKIIPKRAEFYRSLEKRAASALKEGKDIQDPVTQSTIAAQAYADANRAIFMQDNMVTGAYRMVLRYLETKGDVGKTAATGLKTLMPIVKVPTNFVAETANYAAGGVNATIRITQALIKGGLENITPAEADIIMRSLKKQSIGATFLTLGYLNADKIGGYYNGKRDPKDVNAGDLVINGVSVPHVMLHTPLLEVLQMGATLKRVQDSYGAKGKEGAIPASIVATGEGLLKEVPFYEQPARVAGALKSYDSAGKFTGDLAKSLLIPPDVNKITKAIDPVPRRTTNILEQFKASTPYMSRDLPVNWKRLDSMRYEDRQKAIKSIRDFQK